MSKVTLTFLPFMNFVSFFNYTISHNTISYNIAPICSKLLLKLVFFFAISRAPRTTTTELGRTVCFDVTMVMMIKFIYTRSRDKILRLYFHFIKPYYSQRKCNGTFLNAVLGSCLLRKEAGILYQIYRWETGVGGC